MDDIRRWLGWPPARHGRRYAVAAATLVWLWVWAGGLPAWVSPALQPLASAASSAGGTRAIHDAQDIMERVSEALNRIQDIQARVQIVQPGQTSSLSTAVVDVKAKLPNLFRVTYIKPDAFTDMFYVIDRDNRRVDAYYPVTDTVVRQRLDKVLAERSLPVADPQQLLQLPSPESYDLKLTGTESLDRVLHYIVEARPKAANGTVYRFWVDGQRWLISRVEGTDERGRQLVQVRLTQVRVNQGLAENDLRRLPPGAQIQVQS